MAEEVNSANILVIDDEEVMRDSCRQTLSRWGHLVKTAENGGQGAGAGHLLLLHKNL